MFLQILAYITIILFVSGLVRRIIKYNHMPLHLRWELYPVANETKRPYGGSYLEEVDWWTKPRHKSFLGELRFMADELLFFKLYFKEQRKYWYAVYPFHIGVFLLLGWAVLLFAGAMTSLAGMQVAGAGNAWEIFLYYVTLIFGVAGFILTALGTAFLLVRRSTDNSLRPYTAPIDYFYLIFILAIALCGIGSWAFDSTFATAREFVKGVFTYASVNNINPAMFAGIVLSALFLIYMPFTRMMHYVAKFFNFHMVRWNDEPKLSGSKMNAKLAELLSCEVAWSAAHVKTGKNWGEVATRVPKSENAGGK